MGRRTKDHQTEFESEHQQPHRVLLPEVFSRLPLKDFIERFLGLLIPLRVERKFKDTGSKVPVFHSLCEVEKQYHSMLTPYAFKYVQSQLKKSQQVEVIDDDS